MNTRHEDLPLDPATMLEIADDSQRTATTRLAPDDRLLYLVWGLAWLVAFLARWMTSGDDPLVNAPTVGGVIYGVAIASAAVITGFHVQRRVRGVGGATARAGQRWGMTWAVAFTAYPFILGGIDSAGGSDALIGVLAPVLAVFIVGLMYMVGGALWDDSIGFVTGIWTIVIAATAAIVGVNAHLLVLGIGGGGGLFVAAAAAHRRLTTS